MKVLIKVFIKTIILISVSVRSSSVCDVQTVYESKGNITVALLINECMDNIQSLSLHNTLINSAAWTTQRLNYLEVAPFKIGLEVIQTCSEKEVYNTIFKLYQERSESYLLGLVTARKIPEKVEKLCDILNISYKLKSEYWKDLVRATVTLLEAMSWRQNLTVVVPNEHVMEEFNILTRHKGICVGRIIMMGKKNLQLKYIYGHTVIFGNKKHLDLFLNSFYKQAVHDSPEFVFVPLDGLPVKELPEGSYVIHPMYLEDSQKYTMGSKIIPTPLFFDIANPLFNLVQDVSGITSINCNNTTQKLECFANAYSKISQHPVKQLSPFEILSRLKIETLTNQFNYNILRAENVSFSQLTDQPGEAQAVKYNNNLQNFVPVAIFNIFDHTLIQLEQFPEVTNATNVTTGNCSTFSLEECFLNCLNFDFTTFTERVKDDGLKLRSEAWMFAYLAVSALGCLFCLAIILFFFVRICKKDIFEGNPTLTMLLLLIVICMYSSVAPFAINGGPKFQEIICMARSLSVSLSYAAAFSLLLSRCVILATISKEIGFMAHASGPVQIFLGTFMFGVQVALSLQLIENCLDAMHLQCFLCILSYNMILLFLLICTTFFIMKSERNYKEGKYFSIAILLTTCIWGIWVPIYWRYKDWEDEILCFGLVGTASSLLGGVLIPRTYVMTVSVARDKFTSALPALATATSAIDIYRASTQPIYDCINVAAIAANSGVIRSTSLQHPDLYNCPNLADEFVAPKCDTPVDSDKLTRF